MTKNAYKNIRDAYHNKDWTKIQTLSQIDAIHHPKEPNLEILNIILTALGKKVTRSSALGKKVTTLYSKTTLSDLDVGRTLGHGIFGIVLLVRHKSTREVMALKVMSKKTIKKHKLEDQIRKEIAIHSSLEHPNIITYYTTFEDEDKIFILLEYAPLGDLYKLLGQKIKLDEGTLSKYIIQVVEALQYLHKRNVVHRDIKPENVLLFLDGTVKLTDFGFAIEIKPGEKITKQVGTLDYLSPEIVEGRSYDHTTDIWSLGVMIYELATGKAPFEDIISRQKTYRNISQVNYTLPTHLSLELQDLIEKILVKEPTKRLSLEGILAHKWIIG